MRPAAKQQDQIVAVDTHIVMIPAPSGSIPTPVPHPFTGMIDDGLSEDVMIEGMAAAVEGSAASNSPAHVPLGGPFQKTPADKATIQSGSGSVFINGRAAARMGDPAETCNDPADLPIGVVIAAGTVLIGG